MYQHILSEKVTTVLKPKNVSNIYGFESYLFFPMLSTFWARSNVVMIYFISLVVVGIFVFVCFQIIA
jgi:hypothetical protein